MGVLPVSDRARIITGEELAAMGDVGPCELIDGRIAEMTPTSPAHAVIESKLASAFYAVVESRRSGWVMTGEVGIYTRRNPDRVRGADVAVLSRSRAPEGPADSGFLEAAPEVVAEIVSPADSWREVSEKIEEYFEAGAEQVWIVEPRRRVVLIYRSPTEARKYGPEETITGTGLLDGLRLPVVSLFPT